MLKTQKNGLNQDLISLKQERNHFLSSYDSFTALEGILKEKCNIDLKMDLDSVVNLFHGFDEQGYDLKRIIEAYNVATGLEWDIDQKSVNNLQDEIRKLQTGIRGNETLLNISRKSWDTFTQLDTMKFGLEELKQLWLIITDIASNRKIK